mmetsp:Transcript_80044/g.111192  ORF Transcript_80044/g.111192 Transcript_80044/m.111192 type:complete len:110 (+) Transcript_80044:65-394(+)
MDAELPQGEQPARARLVEGTPLCFAPVLLLLLPGFAESLLSTLRVAFRSHIVGLGRSNLYASLAAQTGKEKINMQKFARLSNAFKMLQEKRQIDKFVSVRKLKGSVNRR